jgi:NAD(P)-dependent dehydrogenase (short-subunit alcohol dehydrogenase family)
VVATGRDREATARAVQTLDPSDGRILVLRLDVTDPESIAAARDEAIARLGAVDVLVNNAAVLPYEDAAVLEIPAEGFRAAFETNLLGVVEVCRAFVPAMVKRRYGRVVNVSSGAGQLSRMSTYAPAYSISKAALNAFTRILAATYGRHGVLANAVDPGWVRTDMGGSSAPRSLAKGVETTVWLATLPGDGPNGGFFHDRQPIPW